MNFVKAFSLCALFLFFGCATPVYKEVFREKESYNSKEFAAPQSTLYQATSRALCAKNFIIDKEDPDKGFILGKRSFKHGKRTIVLVVQAKIDSNSADRTMLYLSALETTEISYISDRTRFFLFLIPLPGGGGKEASQIKEGERVIEDKTFYKNFFEAIEKEIANIPQEVVVSIPEEVVPEVIIPEEENPVVLEETAPKL